MLFKLSYLNSNFLLTPGFLNPVLNNHNPVPRQEIFGEPNESNFTSYYRMIHSVDHIQDCHAKEKESIVSSCMCAATSCKSTRDTVPYFGINGLSMILCLWSPLHPLSKLLSNTRPYSKLGGTTFNGREEGGQYYISQTCDQERFDAKTVVFSWECLNIFATGCPFKCQKLH